MTKIIITGFKGRMGRALLSCAAQQAVPFAAELAPDASRGRIVGQVMTGLLTGILLARTASGFLGAWLGWRAVYGVAAGMMVDPAVCLTPAR